MLLAALLLLVTFAASNTSAAWKVSAQSMRPDASSITSESISSVSPLIAALIKKSHNPSSPASNRPAPRATQMVSLSSKPDTSTITPYDPAKLPSYDYAEPEEIRNKLEEELVRKSISTNYEKQLMTNLQQKVARASKNDVNEKISGRRRGNSIEFYMPPKHEDKKINKKSKYLQKSNLMYISTGLTTPGKYEIKRYKKPRKHKRHRKHHEYRRPFSKIGRGKENDIVSRRHQSRYHVERRQDFKLKPIDAPLNSLEITMPADLASELLLQPGEAQSTLLSEVRVHSHPTLDSTQSVATRPNNYVVSTDATTKPLVVLVWHSDQPTNPMPTKPIPTNPMPTHTQPTPSIPEPTKRVHEHHTHKNKHASRKENIPTTTSFGRGYSQKQMQLDSRLDMYFHKKRNVLNKEEKMPERKGREEISDKPVFRFGNVMTTKLPLNALQLDLSPGKSHNMEVMRRKGRICQRNVMIPEGPKYNSLGQTYMPEFRRSPGGPDYPSTKKPEFLIPACCNCCKKSVLGCQ